VIPELPGVTLPHVCTARDILTGKVTLENKKVVVIGGGVTGLETAQLMAGQGNTVSVLEAGRAVGGDLYYTVHDMLLKELSATGVTILTGHKVNEITENALSVTNLSSGESAPMAADAVVLSLGVLTDDTLAGYVFRGFRIEKRTYCINVNSLVSHLLFSFAFHVRIFKFL
jgi:pyruvate/2-oxoglutarate dehydrogenase complex dihydrolipoamide dehydrogenase (E3) component